MSTVSIAQGGLMFVSEKGGREGGGRVARATQRFVCAVQEQLEAMTGNPVTNFMQ